MIIKRRTSRLFLQRDLAGATLTLDDRESHYLGHVLRLKPGDQVVVFNGRGTEQLAAVSALNRRGATLELRERIDPLAESTLAITLIQSLAKAEAMDLIVQKATELGVHAVVPVYTEFSVVKLDEDRTRRRLEHWNRVAQSACEQCGRHTPPRIAAPATLSAAFAALRADALKLVLDPSAAARMADAAPPAAAVTLMVGTEGGLSAEDFRQIDAAGFQRACLGPRVLRAETAAIAACAAAQVLWGDS